jgi:hypothetical protein
MANKKCKGDLMQTITVGLIGEEQSLDGLIVYYIMVALQLNCSLKRSTGLIGMLELNWPNSNYSTL